MTGKDTTLIPKGNYCYTPIGWEDGVYKTMPCPYKEYTPYGTTRCNFLGVESIDPTPCGKEAFKRAVEHFGSEDKVWESDNGGLIWDGIKECGIWEE